MPNIHPFNKFNPRLIQTLYKLNKLLKWYLLVMNLQILLECREVRL